MQRIVRTAAHLSIILLLLGCATHGGMTERQRADFSRGTIALITAPDAETAEVIRKSLKRGAPLPPDAEIIPVVRLDRTDPALARAAARLQDCEVSAVIPPSVPAESRYKIVQRGGPPYSACRGGDRGRSFAEMYEKFDEKAGELLMGLLVVGLVALSIALPFILLD